MNGGAIVVAFFLIVLGIACFYAISATVTQKSKQTKASTATKSTSFSSNNVAQRMPLRRFFRETTLPPSDFVVIDVETTGLDACTNEIIEIGALKYRNGQATERFHSFIKPKGNIPHEASAINHITWDMVSSAPALPAVFPAFLSFIGTDTLLGYNISFDIKFVQTRSQIDISNDVFDVLSFVRSVLPGQGGYKLDDMRRFFNIGGVSHSAIDDCRATAEVYLRCRELPQGVAVSERAFQQNMESQLMMERYQKARAAILEKRKQYRAKMPPRSELNLISAKMVGMPKDYISKAEETLVSQFNVPCSLIQGDYSMNRLILKGPLSDRTLFGVKIDGSLRYVYINLPIEKVTCRFVCGPTSDPECEDGTRVFISSPNEIDEISSILYAAFLEQSNNTLPVSESDTK